MKLVQLPNGDLVIPLEGYVLDGCCIHLSGKFEFMCFEAVTSIAMSEFEMHVNETTRTVSAKYRSDWSAAFDLLGSIVAKCHVSFSTGILTLAFESGMELRVLPCERTEHWAVDIVGASVYKVFSMPGEGYDWWCSEDAVPFNTEKSLPS
jgi:hypothetical protein